MNYFVGMSVNMILRLKYDYYSKGYVIIRNVLNKKDLDKCKDQLILSYKKILRKYKLQKYSSIACKIWKNKEWDKLYIAFKDACQSKPFTNVKKIREFNKKFFNVKTKTLTCAYAIGIKNSKEPVMIGIKRKHIILKLEKKLFTINFLFWKM